MNRICIPPFLLPQDTDFVMKLIDVYPAGAPSPVKGESVLVVE